mmetsp:Transcript_19692/g.23425  ORF Transcript_19692/g.23425 Transcript_19692/m.23425 type:complete len:155 (+) Transcript_19692:129-593(+)
MSGGNYGGVKSKLAAIIANDLSDTSASDSDRGFIRKPKKEPSSYKLWSREVTEGGQSIHNAIEDLGESYTSGKISRFEFENRSVLIEHFSKYKPPEDLPFIVEEPYDATLEVEESSLIQVYRQCMFSAGSATRLMCCLCVQLECCDALITYLFE